MNKTGHIFFMFLFLSTGNVVAQLSGLYNMEYQFGKVPDFSDPENSSLYNDINLTYRQKNVTGKIKVEQYLSEFNDRNYQTISQYALEYKDKGFDFKAGNFYTLVGNGVLLRSYEIKGSVLHDQVFKTKYGFYRDIRGFLGSYRNKHFMVKLVKGSPLLNQIPPTQEEEDRRIDNIDLIESSVFLGNHTLGGAFLRNNSLGGNSLFYTFYADGSVLQNLGYKLEFARKTGIDNAFFEFKNNSGYALYSNLSYALLGLGISVEYKNYHNFFLGSGFNDPPAVVKEHTYKTLNRSTHIPELLDEEGIQTEIYSYLKNGSMFTFNFTWLQNNIPYSGNFNYSEAFVEFYTPIGEETSLKLFSDYAIDELKYEKNRISSGISLEQNISTFWSLLIDVETQFFTRDIITTDKVTNYVASFTISKAPGFSGGFVWEFTNDPFITSGKKNYLGGNVNYKINQNNTLNLFAGNRRGGPACTSGICYEVLDFKGLELKLTSKF